MTKNYQPQPSIGVLLTNLGTPDAPTPRALRRYLREFLSDRRVVDLPRAIWLPILYGLILPLRPRRSAKLYKAIWTKNGSPLLQYTTEQTTALQQLLKAEKTEQPIHVVTAMRYGNPSIQSGLETLREMGARKIIVLPLYPQYSAATSASTFDAVTAALSQWRFMPELQIIMGYCDFPPYIQALAKRIQAYITENGKPNKLVMSFHGIPKGQFDRGDPYYCFCHKTARLLAQACELSADEWQLTFQSRFGRAEWLQPYTDPVLTALAENGAKHVAIICPGFPSDCLETLEEIAIGSKEIFMDAGGERFDYIPALNADDDHIACLGALLKEKLHL